MLEVMIMTLSLDICKIIRKQFCTHPKLVIIFKYTRVGCVQMQ